MDDKFRVFAKNNIEDFEKLEQEQDKVLYAFERIWDNLNSECALCPSKCEDKSECPILLTLIKGLNSRMDLLKNPTPWVGIELDGCLAEKVTIDSNWELNIGAPVDRVVSLVEDFLSKGIEVKIFTPRVSSTNPKSVAAARTIRKWTKKYLGESLQSTAEMDMYCVSLFASSIHQVVPGTGHLLEALFASATAELESTRYGLNRIAACINPPNK